MALRTNLSLNLSRGRSENKARATTASCGRLLRLGVNSSFHLFKIKLVLNPIRDLSPTRSESRVILEISSRKCKSQNKNSPPRQTIFVFGSNPDLSLRGMK
jgi:hypothetical protein